MILSRRTLLLSSAALAAVAATPLAATEYRPRPLGTQVFLLPGPEPRYVLAQVVREQQGCVAYRTLELITPRNAIRADTPARHEAFVNYMQNGGYRWPHTAALANFARDHLEGTGTVCKVEIDARGDLFAEGYGRIRFTDNPTG